MKMPSIYRLVKSTWQLVPERTANSLRRLAPVRFVINYVSRITIGSATHQEIYDERYYNFVDEGALRNSNSMAESLVRNFKFKSLLDVGCGGGAFLMNLRLFGVRVSGLEYSDDGLRRCFNRKLDVIKFDLEDCSKSFTTSMSFDVVTSFEVAEHIPECMADRFVDVLVGNGSLIIMSAAVPGQGGLDHVNEQPHDYWIAKFNKRGFNYNISLTDKIRAEWAGFGVDKWYSSNVMIFERGHL
jgi:cyclopropane fatty-acyl-phospholipid synthase-like methyltransferase